MAKRSRSDSIELGGDVSSVSGEEGVAVHSTETHPLKYASLEPEDRAREYIMSCLLPPHEPLDFATYPEYEKHYQEAHTNRCRECGRNLPSAHFLQLHITENHDPIVASRRERGERTFACFVKDCDKVCLEWKKRRSHLVDKHAFPRNYDFFIVDSGIDGRSSMLRSGVDPNGHRKSSRERRSPDATNSASVMPKTESARGAGNASLETTVQQTRLTVGARHTSFKREQNQIPQDDVDVDTLASSMSTLNMVPRSITFGKRKGKCGFAKQ
ncbi:hypothetical protein K431DRAFT_286526 [Polychaeton citri CBS 116435]|uniref:C2H2-type domain-containing protein n=1 Tax=Polychaeton citri CBS 116435 TaxID=1314669 RepID=A0A9P4Q7E1_9PEZI|nr:hypothetical protein K431DRAFT_286526 [Polychaeton citri CBS 116435]